MEERAACALLKARFEAAGFQIAENVMFEGAGVAFEIDGYDAARRVGYEYVTDEAGDTWDVDEVVIAKLAAASTKGEFFVLVIGEHDAVDAVTLENRADAFLAALPTVQIREIQSKDTATPPEKPPAARQPAPVTKPAPAKQPTPQEDAPKKPAANKPAATPTTSGRAVRRLAATKPAAKKPAAKKPATKKLAPKKPAPKKPATKKPATKKR